MIPECNNFEYATQLTFRLFDHDLDGDDYLGRCFVLFWEVLFAFLCLFGLHVVI